VGGGASQGVERTQEPRNFVGVLKNTTMGDKTKLRETKKQAGLRNSKPKRVG